MYFPIIVSPFLEGPDEQLIAAGATAEFYCCQVQSFSPSIRWQHNGVIVQNDSNTDILSTTFQNTFGSFVSTSQLVIRNIVEADIGTITCLSIISAGTGIAISSSQTVLGK